MKKLILSVILHIIAVGLFAQYVDLGLPSENRWKTVNEEGYFDYETANATFSNQLPCYGDWKELVDLCKWEWTGDGYKITGINGNSIMLPAAGGQACNGEWDDIGETGNYWTSSPGENELGWKFWILTDNRKGFGVYPRSNQASVRLIQTYNGGANY